MRRGSTLSLQLFDLEPQCLVFAHLPREEVARQLCFRSNAGRRKDVEITSFVTAAAVVFRFDEPLLDQGMNTVVRFAEAHPQRRGDLALGEPRARINEADDVEKNWLCCRVYDDVAPQVKEVCSTSERMLKNAAVSSDFFTSSASDTTLPPASVNLIKSGGYASGQPIGDNPQGCCAHGIER